MKSSDLLPDKVGLDRDLDKKAACALFNSPLESTAGASVCLNLQLVPYLHVPVLVKNGHGLESERPERSERSFASPVCTYLHLAPNLQVPDFLKY